MLYLGPYRAISNFAKLNSQICMDAMRKYIVFVVLWQRTYIENYGSIYVRMVCIYFDCSEDKCTNSCLQTIFAAIKSLYVLWVEL